MLQGSLDNFSLDEVLGLLSNTVKTGHLEVRGDRGTGTLALREGKLVGATASNTANGTTTEDVVFELMRFATGEFVFNVRPEVEATEAPRPAAEVLSAAEARLADWRTIEAVVPSLGHTVSPVPALPADEITINRREWSTLIVIGAGCPAANVCEELNLGEVEGSRQIKLLADRGLVSVGPPRSANGVQGAAELPQRGDPFARRAEAGSRRAGALPSGPVAGEPTELPGSLAVSVAREVTGSGVRASRPPMPAPPTSADLRRADNGGRQHMSGGDLLDALTAAEAPEAETAPTPEPTPSKPGGLLMRYLKGED